MRTKRISIAFIEKSSQNSKCWGVGSQCKQGCEAIMSQKLSTAFTGLAEDGIFVLENSH